MNHETPHRDEVLVRLQGILQALAASDEHQRVLFPDFVVRSDELTLEFDSWYRVLLGRGYHRALPPEGVAYLSEIDAVFDRMVDAHEHVWSAEVVAEREEWGNVRHLAARALQALGWPPEGPVL